MQADNDPIAPSRGIPRDDIKVFAIVHPYFHLIMIQMICCIRSAYLFCFILIHELSQQIIGIPQTVQLYHPYICTFCFINYLIVLFMCCSLAKARILTGIRSSLTAHTLTTD